MFKEAWDEGPKEEHKEGQCGPAEGQPEHEKPAMKTIKDNSGPQKPTKSKPAKKA